VNVSRSFLFILLIFLILPAARAQVEPSPTLAVVGHLEVPGGADRILVHENLVLALTRAGLEKGVRFIDIADPTRPTEIGRLKSGASGSIWDLHLARAETASFKGNLLALGIPREGSPPGSTGVEFWDLNDPRQPRLLGRVPTFSGGGPVRLLQRGNQLLALMRANTYELWIVDATDPRRPVLLSIWHPDPNRSGLGRRGVQIDGALRDISVNATATRANIAYGDHGAYLIDISDPAAPLELRRTVLRLEEEGNTRHAVETDDGRVLITSDEDLHLPPAGVSIRVTNPTTLRRQFRAVETDYTRQLAALGPFRGEVVDVGYATPEELAKANPKGKIALVDPLWPIIPVGYQMDQEQARRVAEAGAIGVLFSHTELPPGPPNEQLAIPGMGLEEGIHSMMLMEMKAGKKVEVEMTAGPATYGFVRLWDSSRPEFPLGRLGEFAAPGTAIYPVDPKSPGDSARAIAVNGKRLYAAWGAKGVRVADISDPTQPKEIGHFVPPPQRVAPFPDPFTSTFDVAVRDGLVFLGDRASGLWILRDLPR
jgi:hypothetical protein